MTRTVTRDVTRDYYVTSTSGLPVPVRLRLAPVIVYARRRRRRGPAKRPGCGTPGPPAGRRLTRTDSLSLSVTVTRDSGYRGRTHWQLQLSTQYRARQGRGGGLVLIVQDRRPRSKPPIKTVTDRDSHGSHGRACAISPSPGQGHEIGLAKGLGFRAAAARGSAEPSESDELFLPLRQPLQKKRFPMDLECTHYKY